MSIWQSEEFDNHEQVCLFSDAKTGLRAVVAIHSTTLGPAAGGTRFRSYASDAQACDDALRLSRAMSYKSALAGLPMGGGKAVIIGDPRELKSRDLLLAFGHFINRIGNVFATGEDVGMSVADIEVINEVCPFVGGTSKGAGDPSIHTATGVLHGLRAVAEHRLDGKGFDGMLVAVQGLGAVGLRVAEGLHSAGADLIVADVDPAKVAYAREHLDARVATTEEIHTAAVDIFCPCALGGGISETTAGEIRAASVAGAANNQLASSKAGKILAQRNILFAPDYVINAGGVISGAEAMQNMAGRKKTELAPLEERLEKIYWRLSEIFTRAETDRRTPEATAEALAQELIGRQPVREYA